jgi:hypothetical protein
MCLQIASYMWTPYINNKELNYIKLNYYYFHSCYVISQWLLSSACK